MTLTTDRVENSETFFPVSPGELLDVTSPECPAGSVLTGGGAWMMANVIENSYRAVLRRSYPNADPPTAWVVQAVITQPFQFLGSLTVTAYAVCTRAS